MKKVKNMSALFLLAVAMIGSASAQKKISEGMITYTVSYELPADKQQYADMLPKEITCYFRGDSTAAIVDQGMATIKGISVMKTSYRSMLIDVPSQSKKIVVVLTPDEVAQEKARMPQFTGVKGTEKQTITGYNCTKTTVTDTKTKMDYDIWLTNDVDIPANSVDNAVSSFGGLPVKFITFNNGVKISAVIKEIKQVPVPAGFFTASKDYEPMTYADLKAMSGGN